MQRAFSATTEAGPDRLFAVVSDLATYPDWLDLVDAVESAGEPDAWFVTLRARVGPFSRSKRLRMVRTVARDGARRTVRFDRAETDGKEHSPWVLSAVVLPVPDGEGSEVTLDLVYGGTLWTGPLETILDATAARATERLQAYVAERPASSDAR
ncbi:MAG: SRPBCC family protein [Actinomycetota bacterium]